MHPHDIRVAELTKERDDARAELHEVRVATQATIAALTKERDDARAALDAAQAASGEHVETPTDRG